MLAGMYQNFSTGIRFPRPYGHFALKRGSMVVVKNCAGGYTLPVGLVEGDVVKVLAFDCGYYSVEKDGQTFCISMTNFVR